MAPACLATIFEGDNGGPTTKGVSGTEIRVGIMMTSVDNASKLATDAMFEFFNQHFELYGRRLVPVYLAGTANSPIDARARVADFVSQDVFAVLTGATEVNNPHVSLPIELAREHVVAITRGAGLGWSDRTLYDAWHPYVWSVFPSAEDTQANLADFACRALAGHEATHAGDTALQTTERRFGVIAAAALTPATTTTLARALAECTGDPTVQVAAAGSTETRPALERLKASGVTTMFCICEDDYPYYVLSDANSVGFHPEWVLSPDTSSSNCQYECQMQNLRRGNVIAPPMQLNAGPRVMPVQSRMWFAPISQLLSLPGANLATMLGRAEMLYTSLLVLSSGIQGAGPTLSPDAFAQALFTMSFPNPGAGQAPYWQPTAGFGPGDHSFYDDYSVAWWSDDAEAFEQFQGASGKGSWCYLDQAARFRVGTYPVDAEARLYNRGVPCR